MIIYKYNVTKKIADFGKRVKKKFFYNLSECEFCIDHHFGIVAIGVWALLDLVIWYLHPYLGGYAMYMFYPFLSASLMNIIKTIRNEDN